MITARDLYAPIGRNGEYTADGRGGSITVHIRVADARQVFGRLDYLITPTKGSGSRWVDSQYVQLSEGE